MYADYTFNFHLTLRLNLIIAKQLFRENKLFLKKSSNFNNI